MDINKLLNAKRVTIKYLDIDVDNEDVKNFRRNNDLTQVALANILGVKKKTVEKWEQGKNKINGSSAVLITLLKKNPDVLKMLYAVQQVDRTYTDYRIIASYSAFKVQAEDIESIMECSRSSYDIPKSSKLALCGGV